MHLETTTMDTRFARIHYLDYVKRVRIARQRRMEEAKEDINQKRRDFHKHMTQMEKEDTELLKAYRALYRGQQIIHMPSTLMKAGMDQHMMPKLAICKADGLKCHLYFRDWRMMVFSHISSPFYNKAVWKSGKGPNVYTVQDEVRNEFRPHWRNANNYSNEATALVPAIPAHLRPDDPSKYWILWEAEWSRKAPLDPVLLSRVNETMFAVVAQWDLTPLEQRVLEGRLG